MSKFKNTLLKNCAKWHRRMGWAGGLALLLFAISAITHPLMLWTSPKATSFFPPQVKIDPAHVTAVPQILSKYKIASAQIVRVVPSSSGALLQISDNDGRSRRYFDLKTTNELPDQDLKQARWLASYYTGLQEDLIKEVEIQTQFDNSYPWVNRLLPVYKISFNTSDNRKVFIHTELSALGNITNDWKTMLQSVFQILHTWNWLDGFELIRVPLMMVFLLSLTGLAIAGMGMIFLMNSRVIKDSKRRVHRYGALVIWLPLLALSVSGIYHLLYYALPGHKTDFNVARSIALDPDSLTKDTQWIEKYNGKLLNNLSLINSPDGKLLYRISLPQGRAHHKVSHHDHFGGTPKEKAAHYFDARTGEAVEISDKEIARHYALMHSGFEQKKIKSMSPIRSFGPEYDFRNKRLPVWRVDFDTSNGDTLFVDPANAIIVDQMVNSGRYESYVFSVLHKWSFLTPQIGRFYRDILVVVLLAIGIASALFGYALLLNRKRKRKT